MKERTITVRVIAGAKTEFVEETGSDAFKVKVRTVAEKGKANQRVIELLATYFDISRSGIVLKRGETSKEKVFVVEDR